MTETFIVPHMKCEGCVKAIKEGLASLPGVAAVEVDLARKEVRVEGEASRQAIAEKLKALGYPPNP